MSKSGHRSGREIGGSEVCLSKKLPENKRERREKRVREEKFTRG